MRDEPGRPYGQLWMMELTTQKSIRFGGDKDKAAAVYAGMQPLTPDDIAAAIGWAASLPDHVNVNTIELMPVAQSFAPFQVDRRT